jgi:hypothetical protein
MKYRSTHKVTKVFGHGITNYGQFVVIEGPNSNIIAFRPTDCRADWIKDFLFIKQSEKIGVDASKESSIAQSILCSNESFMDDISKIMIRPLVPTKSLILNAKEDIKAHGGILQLYNESRVDLQKIFKPLTKSRKPIYMCGWSLGGGLCRLALYDLKKLYPDCAIKGATFGSPRIANKEFENDFYSMFGEMFKSYVFEKDIIARLPPKTLNFADPIMRENLYNEVDSSTPSDDHEIQRYMHALLDRV